jgi:GTP-binding protein EngB required for normal cell division
MIDNLEKKFERVAGICTQFQMAVLEPQLNACRELLQRKDLLMDIGVFGRFKAGKSSFINHLAAQSVLPVGVTPVTAIITRIRYASGERAMVHYSQGTSEEVKLGDLALYISEAHNPQNQKQVASVDIEVPTLKPYSGLQLIDTPGLGSVFKHNTETSLSWLPKAGVALVAISVDAPLSEQDISLISELRRFTSRICILLTKSDLLSDAQREEVQRFTQTQLQRQYGATFPLYFYSTIKGEDGFRSKLDQELLKPLIANREHESKDILAHKLDTLARECSEYLKIAHRSASVVKTERAQLKNRVLGEKDQWNHVQDEIRIMLRELLGRTRPAIMRRFSEIQQPLLAEATESLSPKLQEWNVNLWKLTRSYEEWLRAFFAGRISELTISEQALFHEPIENAGAAFNRMVNSFENRLTKNIETVLGIKFLKPEFKLTPKTPRIPDISVGRVFDSHLDTLWFLIPMFIFRKMFHRHFLNQLPFEVEKNLSRFASQWTVNINDVIQEMASEAEQFIRDEIATVERLLENTGSDVERIDAGIRELGGRTSSLA